MEDKKQVFVRLGVSDAIVPKEMLEKFNGWLVAIGEDGKILFETHSYVIEYEDEDGEECDEDGILWSETRK